MKLKIILITDFQTGEQITLLAYFKRQQSTPMNDFIVKFLVDYGAHE